MLTNICKKELDLDVLDERIEIYKVSFFAKDPTYLIMNEDTVRWIAEKCNCTYLNNDYGSRYRGCNIAIDNTLEYGGVEIR